MLDPKPTKNHAYRFQRIFTDGEFMAGGVLVIPPNEAKPLKPARDNTYVSDIQGNRVQAAPANSDPAFPVDALLCAGRGEGAGPPDGVLHRSGWLLPGSKRYVVSVRGSRSWVGTDPISAVPFRAFRELVSDQQPDRCRCRSGLHAGKGVGSHRRARRSCLNVSMAWPEVGYCRVNLVSEALGSSYG